MNYQVDVMIIGDSKVGHEILDKIASSKPSIKVAFISKAFKSTTTHDYLNVEYFRDEVVFTDYKNRLFGCYLKKGTRIYGTHLIIASGVDYEPLILANGKPASAGVYSSIDDVPKNSKSQPAVVVCSTNADVKFAIDVAKKYKQVYLCVKDSTIEGLTEANAKKLDTAENIVVLQNTSVLKTISKDGVLLKVELDNYSTLNCSAIYTKTDAIPVTSFVSDKLIQKTENGYLAANENAESTIVPKLFAAGNCAQKYTKAMAQNLVEVVLNDF
jgi:thioredoxin reductase